MSIEKNERNPDDRVYLYQFLDVIDQHTNKHLGYLSDFSTGGLMFITNQSIATNQIKDIYIVNDVEDETITIKAKIVTVWIKPNINPQMNCIGCHFLEIDAENRRLLEKTGSKLCYESRIEVHREADE